MANITGVTIEQYGYLRIFVDGRDVTFHQNGRGHTYATVPTAITRVTPFTYKDAGMIFPGFDPRLDAVEVGDWSFLKRQSFVHIARCVVNDDGTTTVAGTEFIGHVNGWAAGPEGLTVGCTGLAYWADGQVVPPKMDTVPLENLEDYVQRVFDAVRSRPWPNLMVAGQTNMQWAARGDYSSPINLVSQALASSYTADGDWWTIAFEGANGYQPVLRAVSTAPKRRWTFQYDEIADVFDVTVSTDQIVTTIFGYGVTPEGLAWRNAVWPHQTSDDTPVYPLPSNVTWTPGSRHPGFGPFVAKMREMGYTMYSTSDFYDKRDTNEVLHVQWRMGSTVTGNVGPTTWTNVWEIGRSAFVGEPEILPLVELETAREFDRNAAGQIVRRNPHFDPHLRINAKTIDFGDGVPRAVATQSAIQILEREKFVGISGTMGLQCDPAEGHRLEIAELDEILIHGWEGGDLLLYVSQVQKDFVGMTNSIQVSSRPGPTTTVADEIHNRRDSTDPARRGIKTSTQQTGVVWESDSPAGIVPRFASYARLGATVQVPVPRRGSFSYSWLKTHDMATRFIAIVSTQPVTPAILEDTIGGNPWDLDDSWDSGNKDALDALGVVMAWGSSVNPCGYGMEDPNSGAPMTGEFMDGGSWDYEAPYLKLWLTVWPEEGTVFEDCRFYPSPLS